MMLFDASSLIAVIIIHGRHAIDILREQATLTLAAYEIGNAVWRKTVLKAEISLEEAVAKLARLEELFKLMRVYHPESKEDFAEILRVAARLKTTFYDSAYLYFAKKLRARLVTEDRRLMRAAGEFGVEVVSAGEIS